MEAFESYATLAELSRSNGFVLLRARHGHSGRSHLLRLSVHGGAEAETQLRHEHEWLRGERASPVVRAARLGSSFALIIEESGAQTLFEWLSSKSHGPAAVASVFADLAASLAKAHRRGQPHGALDHNTIILSGPQLTPILLGSRPHSDADADIHALGVCLYQALTGKAPYAGHTPLELRHRVETNALKAPAEIADVPMYLSQLTMRLLSRTHRERYRMLSAAHADLRKYAQQDDVSLVLDTRADVLGRLEYGRSLYGRGQALRALDDSYAAARAGDFKAVVLRGPTGVGKSALVDALLDKATRDGAHVAVGKFDQFQRGLSSSAVTQILRSLTRRMLGLSRSALEAWRDRLLTAIGPGAGVLVELVPELDAVLADLPKPEQLGPSETHNRLVRAVVELVASCTETEVPTILFADDLQWSDAVSRDLLGELVVSRRLHRTLIVVASRRGDRPEDHPTMKLLSEIGSAEHGQLIDLAALSAASMEQWIADIVDDQADVAKPLARMLFAKTQGNPLFSLRILRHLAETEALQVDPHTHRWKLDVEALQATAVANNLLSFLGAQLQALGPLTNTLLHQAACLGDTFRWQDLELICTVPKAECIGGIREAMTVGLLTLTSRGRPVAAQDAVAALSSGQSVVVRFHHDQIQQAAYQARSAAETQSCHDRIGTLLAQELPPEEVHERIFEIAGHINHADNASKPPAQQRRVIELNLAAAGAASRATEFDAYRGYIEHAFDCIASTSWEHDYELRWKLHLERARAQYLAGELDLAEESLATCVEHARTPLEKARALEVALAQLTVQGHYEAGLRHALEALELCGYGLSEDLPEEEMAFIDGVLHTERVANLPTDDAMAEPEAQLAMAVLSDTLPLTFIARPELFPAVVAQGVMLSLDRGPAPQSAICFAAYGILMTTQHRYVEAARFGEMALVFADRFGDTSQLCRAGEIVLACIHHWSAPLSQSSDIAVRAFNAGLESGDLQYAGYVLLYDFVNRFAAGAPLASLSERYTTSSEFCRKHDNQISRDVLDGCSMVVERHLGETATDGCDREADFLRTCEEHSSLLALQIYHTYSAQHAFVCGDVAAARNHAAMAAEHSASAPGVISLAILDLYVALIGAAHERTSTDDAEWEQRARDARERMAAWADAAPENFAHKRDLIDAEQARNRGDTVAAFRLYDEAIRGAQRGGFVQEQALASELAAGCYADSGIPGQARTLGAEASKLWRRWGDAAHADQVARQHSEDASDAPSRGRKVAVSTEALLRAGRALSGELESDALLRKLVHTAMLFAGFETTVLVLREGDALVPRTMTSSGPSGDAVVDASGDTKRVPLSMLRLAARTGMVKTYHCGQFGDLASDPYLRSHAPATAVAIPWQHQGETVAVLYLENRVAQRELDTERTRQLQFLGAQGAQSIQNARLYESLREEIAQRLEAENELASALADREVMLRELDHRVKNNLQWMSALLSLTFGRDRNVDAREVLHVSQQRILAMASVHEHLSERVMNRDDAFAEYVSSLVLDTVVAYRPEGTEPELDLSIDLVEVDFEIAGPCGLILHELVSNACKHSRASNLTLRVELREEGPDFVLVVADNGSGDAELFFDPSRHSTGMTLVQALTSQLRGTMSVRREGGLVCTLRAPRRQGE